MRTVTLAVAGRAAINGVEYMNDANGGRQIRWYEVVYVLVLLGLLVMSVFFMNPHKVGVVDIDRVFKDVGMMKRVEQDRQQMEAFKRGTALVEAHNVRMGDLNRKLEVAATQADKDKLRGQVRLANDALQQGLAPIQNALHAHENLVIASFRKRLQPYVTSTARKRRLDIVMYAGPALLYTRDKADITDDIIAASKSYFAKDMPLIDPTLTPKTPVGRR
jgi:Skp family chaperone for outer membrane proteins